MASAAPAGVTPCRTGKQVRKDAAPGAWDDGLAQDARAPGLLPQDHLGGARAGRAASPWLRAAAPIAAGGVLVLRALSAGATARSHVPHTTGDAESSACLAGCLGRGRRLGRPVQ